MKKTISFKRRRLGKTNYKTRKQLLTSSNHRAIVRRTNKHIILQAASYAPTGDKIILTITTKELEKKGWKGNTKNTSAAYLVGLLFGKKIKEKGISKVTPDLGMYTTVKGCKLFAVLKGIKDAGVNVPVSNKILPGEDRIKGKHISLWAEKANEKDKNHFQKYKKKSLDAKKITEHFEEVKNKILK